MPRTLGMQLNQLFPAGCQLAASKQQALASSKRRSTLAYSTTTLRYSRIIRLAHCTNSRASEGISVDPDARFGPAVEADGSDHYHCSVGPIVSNVKTKWILRPTRRTLPIMKHFSQPTLQLDLLPSPLTPPTWARGQISSPPFQLRHRHLA